LGSLYITLLTIGSYSSVTFCFDHCYGNEIDNGFLAKYSFVAMALAVLIPTYTSFYKLYFYNNINSHFEWILRGYAGLWGSYFFYRVLILFVLPFASHFYHGYILLSWAGWLIPQVFIEHYIGYLREKNFKN
jgi:hypothetical protein